MITFKSNGYMSWRADLKPETFLTSVKRSCINLRYIDLGQWEVELVIENFNSSRFPTINIKSQFGWFKDDHRGSMNQAARIAESWIKEMGSVSAQILPCLEDHKLDILDDTEG